MKRIGTKIRNQRSEVVGAVPPPGSTACRGRSPSGPKDCGAFGKRALHFALIFCLLFSVLCFLTTTDALANNVVVENVSITEPNASAETCKVEFDISWENSWRDSTGNMRDAVWVFMKYSTNGAGGPWYHATLKGSGDSAGSGTGLTVSVPTDKMGAFLYRSAEGNGTVTTTDVQLVWDWGEDGLSASDTARVKVFAIEMVYVPTGAFYAGDGATGFTLTQITTADASQVGSGVPTGQTACAASFPNGYNGFYLMKYEISQQQWVDFFNTLTSAQKVMRDITAASGDGYDAYSGKAADSEYHRNTVSWTSGDASAGDNDEVACNWICWPDVIAYADWAALRPMTELEYEKACRGTASAVAGEYPWGGTSIVQARPPVVNSGESNEVASSVGSGLCVYGGDGTYIVGPLRCGFAAISETTRAEAGAGYYGNMGLAGGLWKLIVTLSTATGRAFTGLNGDGELDTDGEANVTNWPGTDAVGSGMRSSYWLRNDTYVAHLQTSSRAFASLGQSGRLYSLGSRCARTA